MNKKLLVFGVLSFLAIAVVSAVVLEYFGQINQEIVIESPIIVNCPEIETISGYSLESLIGEDITLNNQADFNVLVKLENNASESGINVDYLSNLVLTKKIVVFGETHWEIPEDAETINVEYTLSGEEFSAEVTEGMREDYTLIYYKDNSDRFNSPAKVIEISSVEGNLPYEDDQNIGDYDYCKIEGYTTCNGAKIWYVPKTAILEGNELDWSRAEEFYFETELIQYNSEGKIIIYPNQDLVFNPLYKIGAITGEETIKTSIKPIIS